MFSEAEILRVIDGEEPPKGWKVRREKKMVLLIGLDSEKAKIWDRFNVLAYPTKEHIEQFKKAVFGTKPGGPGYRSPCSIGSLRLVALKDNKTLFFNFLQSHYKTSGIHSLPRALHTKYAGWRERAIEEAVDYAKNHGQKIIFSLVDSQQPKKDYLEFRKACVKLKLNPKEILTMSYVEP